MLNNILIYIATFLFFFSSLTLLRLLFNFISSLISYKKMTMNVRELTFYGITISYFLTYIIFKI